MKIEIKQGWWAGRWCWNVFLGEFPLARFEEKKDAENYIIEKVFIEYPFLKKKEYKVEKK